MAIMAPTPTFVWSMSTVIETTQPAREGRQTLRENKAECEASEEASISQRR
jgi:hypothetical protein